jgi:GTPase SAR1 family protein
MAGIITRPALGHVATIGTLYDARNETFLPTTILRGLLPDAVETLESPRKRLSISYIDTYDEKFKKLGLSTEQSATILAGLITSGGPGSYLNEERDGNNILHAAVYHTIAGVQEELNLTSPELRKYLTASVIRTSQATHVVTGIEWGSEDVVTFRHRMTEGAERSDAERCFRSEVEAFEAAAQDTSIGNSGQRRTEILLEIVAYGDTATNRGMVLHDSQNAHNFLKVIPHSIKAQNGGKGKPITYTLFPVDMLRMFLPIQVQSDVTATLPSNECLQKYIQLFDRLRAAYRELNDNQSYAVKNRIYIGDSHLQAVAGQIADLTEAMQRLKSNFARLLRDVREGNDNPEKLWQLVRDRKFTEFSAENIGIVSARHRDKVEFVKMMLDFGATYIGYNGMDLSAELTRHRHQDAYVFSFSDRARDEEQSWHGNQDLWLKLLTDKNRKYFAVVDHDAMGVPLETARIAHFQNLKEITGDLFEQQKYLSDKSFARCPDRTVDREDVKKPLKRRFVKIACPGPNCHDGEVCDWICPQCQAPLEYGYTDQYMYCDCGRSLYYNYEFMCKNEHHGENYSQYDRSLLLSLLNSLTTSENLNILILGETGVGKSTFINAFVNYLSFRTLDEAMAAERLEWVIPCSFSTQVMDRSQPDSEIRQIEVKVGSRDDEHDGSNGDSATQETKVYPVTIGTRTIRLIDTPGIGDTRGPEFDKKNMADILQTLGSYEALHGILILLKSNNSRLNVTFRYCVTDLLVHLHRSAANNMAFGFTNTRISNYTPGDTFKPLTQLLANHPDVGLGLSSNTTYCFDSESFRFLAAYKDGTAMENIQDFQRSWDRSAEEAHRLINYFTSRPPHQTRTTLNLNGTRQLISEMTKPMAEISQLIRTNIARAEDQMKELSNDRLTGDKLRNRLLVQKVLLKPEMLSQPRTVCSDDACTDYKDDGTGMNRYVTVYKTLCHAPCFLSDVTVDQIAPARLMYCNAFGGTDRCIPCGHHWSQHLHKLVELKEETVLVTDDAIEKQLAAHANDMTLKQTAIRNLQERIDEYKQEHLQIQNATARFGLFLKKWSITPYNDQTLAYLDHLIKEEWGKVQAGGNRKRLDDLEEDRRKHEEMIKVLAANVNKNTKSNDLDLQPLTEEGVDKLIKQLYGLKHFGKNLLSVKKTITAAHQATYREHPYRVGGQFGGAISPGIRTHPPPSPYQLSPYHQQPRLAPRTLIKNSPKTDTKNSGLSKWLPSLSGLSFS